MDDDNSKEKDESSTSKKESNKVKSGHDLSDDEGRQHGRSSNSDSCTSGEYSVKMDIADRNFGSKQEVSKPSPEKARPGETKKRSGRRPGRVEKRRRSMTRRRYHRVSRKVPKRRQRAKVHRKERDNSLCTIFTRMSSGSDCKTPGCQYCGHRCCLRRYEYEREMQRKKFDAKRKFRPQGPKRKKVLPIQIAESIQAGSRSLMLSPLCINSSIEPRIVVQSIEEKKYCEISPDMLYQTIQKLTKWRQYAKTEAILSYIKIEQQCVGDLSSKVNLYRRALQGHIIINSILQRVYPVNSNEEALLDELMEKLRVAVAVGILIKREDAWSLTGALQKRGLTQTHVTMFWQIYGDTMKPVVKKPTEVDSRFLFQQERPLLKRDTKSDDQSSDRNKARLYTEFDFM